MNHVPVLDNHNTAHEACTIVIFGATGDLCKRKLIPAIYKLIEDKKLTQFTLIGAAIDNTTPNNILEAAKKFVPKAHPTTWQILADNTHFHQMDFHDNASYKPLYTIIQSLEQQQQLPGKRIFYFATMPEHFAIITTNLLEHGIVHPSRNNEPNATSWTRLVYEKPFGWNKESSDTINDILHTTFSEQQIFRIDHFLGKELTSNIALARFTNRIFEPLWNNNHIESVHICVNEDQGIGNRGRYYDKYGALKDMVQSHLLQLLALTAMEKPPTLTANHIRDYKAKVLEQVEVIDALFGQYEGYKEEEFVNPESTTDTFAALKLRINNERWQGVPFYLSSGKCLQKKEATITLVFKMAECLLTHCPSEPNKLTIKIQPDDGIYLQLNAKIPGQAYEVAPVSMDFCHSCLFGPNTPEAYEVLLWDVIKGDQSAFIRSDEVTLSWNIINQIPDTARNTIHTYQKGSAGPTLIKKFCNTHSNA